MPPQEKMPDAEPQDQDKACLENGFANRAFVSDDNSCQNGNSCAQENDISCNQIKENNNACIMEEEDVFEFDDFLPYIGEFGTYQKILFLLMIPFACFVAWVYFTQIFITLVPEEHWCWVPELANLTVEQRVALAIPRSLEGGLDKCNMYQVDWRQILRQNRRIGDPSWPTVPCTNGWEYNLTEIPYPSIATELDWVCDNSALPHTAQSVFFCGAILGGLIFGWIADRMGRIPALVGSNLVGCIGGIATAFCHSFLSFSICRFLVGMAFDNCFTMMYILVLEYVGPKWRTFVANMSIAIFFTFAATILPWIAYFVKDWRILCYITSVPLAISIFTPWLIPESARWLVSQGKIDKAIQILRKFQRINKTDVKEETYSQFKLSCLKSQKEEDVSKTYTVLDLFRSPRLRRTTIVMILMWMAISLVFDGHVRNVGSLGLDVFLTFTVASFTEFPADTFLTLVLDRWGRRWLACGSMVIGGVFSLLATAVPLGVPSATLAIMGRFAVNITYNIGLQYAAELLPTVVRAQGVALVHIMGYVASILAPFVVYLGNVQVSLPLFILGVLGIFGGMLALLLPETLDQELPQTLQDGENFGANQKFLDMPCIKSRSKCSADITVPNRESFRRSLSTRGSVRGEIRSSMIYRSIRSRKSIDLKANQIA